MTEVWIHNYRGHEVYKTAMPNVPRVGEVIADGPEHLMITQVEWFEYTKRHQWVARIWTKEVHRG